MRFRNLNSPCMSTHTDVYKPLEGDYRLFMANSTTYVFVSFRPPYLCPSVVHSLINLSKTFLRISPARNIAQTWIFARLFEYSFSFTSLILDLICFMVLMMVWHRKPTICIPPCCNKPKVAWVSFSFTLSLLSPPGKVGGRVGRGGRRPRENVLLGGKRFCEGRSFMWQQVLHQQVLIDNKFYTATRKQVSSVKQQVLWADAWQELNTWKQVLSVVTSFMWRIFRYNEVVYMANTYFWSSE